MGLLTSSTNHFSCLRGARSPMEVWKYDPHHLLLTFVFLGPVNDGPISSDPHSDRRSGLWVGKQEVLLVRTLFFFSLLVSYFSFPSTLGGRLGILRPLHLGFRISSRMHTHTHTLSNDTPALMQSLFLLLQANF